MLYLLLHNIGALFLMIGEDTTAKKVSPVFSFSRISLDLFWAVNPILQNKSVITAFLVIVESWTQYPEGLVLVEVGDTVLLVGDTDDFRRFCIGIYHRYNYTYV